MRPRRGSRGFSLLEVMVAFTILAMLLGALFQVFSTALGSARSAERLSRATVIAQSRLAGLGFDHDLKPGVSTGTVDGDFHWRVTVGGYSDGELSVTSTAVRPLTVNVEVYWEEGGFSRSVSLTSLMLAPSRS